MIKMMKKLTKTIFIKESGVTLVELLASIFLLSVIVTTFFSFFVQAGRTNNKIDDMNEATFLAQEQLELITAYSEQLSVAETESKIATTKNGYTIQVTFEPKGDLQAVIVIVSKEEKALAQMETRLSFEK